ncbi:MAG TPA: hypothetical protein VL241_06290 [Gemmatimonadales bacterium]|jgi:hypothetical protein|nr:hypothetical protein [Gemmatimonadales bacterium]
MSAYKTDQYHIVHRGREFHFVSYEARQANVRTGEEAMPATWFLMSEGKRWPVIAQVPDQTPELLIAALTRWLDQTIFAARRA